MSFFISHNIKFATKFIYDASCITVSHSGIDDCVNLKKITLDNNGSLYCGELVKFVWKCSRLETLVLGNMDVGSVVIQNYESLRKIIYDDSTVWKIITFVNRNDSIVRRMVKKKLPYFLS